MAKNDGSESVSAGGYATAGRPGGAAAAASGPPWGPCPSTSENTGAAPACSKSTAEGGTGEDGAVAE